MKEKLKAEIGNQTADGRRFTQMGRDEEIVWLLAGSKTRIPTLITSLSASIGVHLRFDF
jgi:hypothetical protein